MTHNNKVISLPQTVKLNRLLFNIIVFFAFFDGIRSNLILSNYLTLVREGATFLLIGLTFVSLPKPRFNVSIWTLLLFMVYHTVIVFCSVTQEGPITRSFVFRPYELIGIIFIIDNYRELTCQPYRRLIRLVINTAIAFGIINITLYYLLLPIWNRDSFWWGRISCGYPTMDVISLSYALVFLLHYKNIGWKTPKVVLYAALLSIFIFLNFSGTGSLLLLLILLLSIFFHHSRRAAGSVFIIGSLVFVFGLVSLQQYFPIEYSQGETLLETKLKNLKGDNSADANTLEIREEQFAIASRKLDNFFVELVGIGINYATNDNEIMKRYKDSFMIENEYNLLRVCYGLIGLVIFVSFILQMVLAALKSRNIIGLMGGCVFAVNSFTLIPFVLYPNVVMLALVYVLITTNESHRNPYSIVRTKLGNIRLILKRVPDPNSYTNRFYLCGDKRVEEC